MGDLLLAGISHYPPLREPDAEMAGLLRFALADPDTPDHVKDTASWPEEMRREWAEFPESAGRHREALVSNFLRVRQAIDEFQPDVIVMWGDDQYENFHEDVIPPFCVLAYDETTTLPWHHVRRGDRIIEALENVWGEPPEQEYVVKGSRLIGKHLVSGLLEEGFDMAYSYEPLHHPGLPHAFLNALMFLDYDRNGFPYALLPVAVNCYGKKVISAHGGPTHFGSRPELDPPSPSPSRCFDLGAATARIMAASPWRTAIVASSSWSHAFLTDHTWRLQPDLDRDRYFFDALLNGQFDRFRTVSLGEIEDAYREVARRLGVMPQEGDSSYVIEVNAKTPKGQKPKKVIAKKKKKK